MNNPVILVVFNHEQPARLLINYLKTKNIFAQYRLTKGEHTHGVVLENDLQLSEAKKITEQFLANPNDNKYQQAAWQKGQSVNLQQKTKLNLTEHLGQLFHSPFTALILILCCAVYAISILGGFVYIKDWFMFRPFTELVETQQWWRLIGPAFIHFSGIHIIFNLLWWWSIGGQIERKFGSSTLIILFLFAAICSNVGQFLVSGANFGGLSGVVYAVIGFVWWTGWLKPTWGLSLPKPLIGFLLIWLVLGYADLLWVSMANTAHTVGLISGCLAAWLMVKYSDSNQTKASRPDKDIW